MTAGHATGAWGPTRATGSSGPPALPGVYHQRPQAGEVVAGLVNDGSADSVARAAVEEAATRHCAVRFVQVVPGPSSGPTSGDPTVAGRVVADHVVSDERTFSAAMHALSRHSRVPATFEVVSGDPVAVLVSRTAGASVLVLGEDQVEAATAVAAQAQRGAQCPVRLVPLTGTPVSSAT